MTNILGISAYYHDSAAAPVHDGDIIAAAQEERFSDGLSGTGELPARQNRSAAGRDGQVVAKEYELD